MRSSCSASTFNVAEYKTSISNTMSVALESIFVTVSGRRRPQRGAPASGHFHRPTSILTPNAISASLISDQISRTSITAAIATMSTRFTVHVGYRANANLGSRLFAAAARRSISRSGLAYCTWERLVHRRRRHTNDERGRLRCIISPECWDLCSAQYGSSLVAVDRWPKVSTSAFPLCYCQDGCTSISREHVDDAGVELALRPGSILLLSLDQLRIASTATTELESSASSSGSSRARDSPHRHLRRLSHACPQQANAKSVSIP